MARAQLYSRGLRLIVAMALLSGVGSCEQDDVSVSNGNQSRAYGRTELLAAIQRFSTGERTPGKYRQMARTIEALQSRFNESVQAEAERHLLMLALVPLEAHYHKKPEQRMRVLGTTVWPTALGQPPAEGETPEQYTERICASALALECKYVVPEYRALMLSAVVWERLQERLYDAIRECDGCRGQQEYQDALDRYERYERDVATQAHKADDQAKPSRWPVSGEHASPWSKAPLIEIAGRGAHRFQGQAIEAGAWLSVLRAARQDHELVGVFIRASERVSELRAVLRAAHAAGFDEIALQVRSSKYPYPLGEYRLSTTDKAAGRESLRVRDIDTIQVLVQGLDAAVSRGVSVPRI